MQGNTARKRKSSRSMGLGKGNASDPDAARENKALAHLGQNWVERTNTILAFENLNINYAWDEQEVKTMIAMSENGHSVADMAGYFKRSQLDIRVMLFSLALENELDILPHDI